MALSCLWEPCTAMYVCCIPAEPPTSGALSVTPVSVDPSAQMLRPVGTASSSSRDRTCPCVALLMSTTGEAPVTVTVSSTAPIFISELTVAVKSDGSSIPSRLTTLKPGSVNFTMYEPGRRSMMRYSPAASPAATLLLTICRLPERPPKRPYGCDAQDAATEWEPRSDERAGMTTGLRHAARKTASRDDRAMLGRLRSALV